jgi:outer membrane protein OmpA-like peptidoglycan-associated protein
MGAGSQFGTDAVRISTVGPGESKPAVPNMTPEEDARSNVASRR